MSRRESVLVVDQKNDTTEVLQAVFEPKGIAVSRVRRWMETGDEPRNSLPSVVVWDADSTHADDPLQEHVWTNVPRIVIGGLIRPNDSGESGQTPKTHYLGKPFEFGELMRAIETLISTPALSGNATASAG